MVQVYPAYTMRLWGFLVVGMFLGGGCTPTDRPQSPEGNSSRPLVAAATSECPTEIRLFCGNCHRLPSPDCFPRDAWYSEVQRGFNFYTDSGRSDLHVPVLDSVVQWYRSQAPQELTVTTLLDAPSLIPFRKVPVLSSGAPMVSSLDWEAASGDWPSLRFSEMETGLIAGVDTTSMSRATVIATGSHVAGTRIVDLDQDQKLDLLLCELGSKSPGDHALGRVSYLSSLAPGARPQPLLTDVGRVADAMPGDFDRDGDLDLVVSEFGWLKTGSISVLENIRSSMATGQPLRPDDFRRHRIDVRHGTIHVCVTDLNQDQLPDIVALISQEHETVVAFINEGHFQFRQEVIMEPQDPSNGSCGIEMIDLDSDGDQDFVYCNGDTLDSYLIKPYHGVWALMNEGMYPYQQVRLLTLPGASDSTSGDLDGDGDLDIAVSAYLPQRLLPQLPEGRYDSLCWLEQVAAGKFVPHSIEKGTIGHLGLTSGDFDGNGTIDLAVGDSPGAGWGAIWWNENEAKASSPLP